MDAERIYRLILRSIVVAAGLLGLTAVATAWSVQAPLLLVWAAAALAAGLFARQRLVLATVE